MLAVDLSAAAGDGAVTNDDQVEAEYRKVLRDDDAAEQDVLGWVNNAEASAKAGSVLTNATLHLRIERRMDSVHREYQDFVDQHPNHVNARLAYGSFLYDMNDQDGAVAQWEKARQLAPTNPATWNNLAKYYGQAGPVTKAFEYYDKAISLDTNQSVYYHNQAALIYLFRKQAADYYHLTEQQTFEKSLDLYRTAIKLAPDDFVLFTDYAQCFYGCHPPRLQEGLEAWSQALKLARDEAEREGVYLHLARIHLRLGQYEQARTNLDAVTNMDYAEVKNQIASNLVAALSMPATNTVSAGGAPVQH
jgi:tetratricopeptide (TPR) repeat protein